MDRRIDKWARGRRNTISKLKILANELEGFQKNVNITKIGGTASSIAFGIGSAVAGIVSIFTAGAAIPVAVGLGIAAGVSGATTAGSAFAKFLKDRTSMKDAQKAIDEDDKETKEIREYFEELVKLTGIEKENSKTTAHGVASGIVSGVSKANAFASVASSFGPEILRLVGNVGDDALAISGRVFATMGQVTKIAGPVLSLVIIPLDIYTLVKTSIDVKNESPNDIAVQLRKHAETLQEQLDSVIAESNKLNPTKVMPKQPDPFLDELRNKVKRFYV